MTLDGARVYFKGMKENNEYHDKIHQIVNTVKSLSPSAKVSMMFLKNGNLYEALLWGKASEVPIGVYNRGQSMAQVLDTLDKKVKKLSLKVFKMKGAAKLKEKPYFKNREPIARAG